MELNEIVKPGKYFSVTLIVTMNLVFSHTRTITQRLLTLCRYVSLQSCLTLLPENGLGGDLPEWPARLSTPPRRLETIVMDATQARSYVFKSDQRYWHVVVEGYLRGLGLHKEDFRNIMDMRAMYGGYGS